MNSDQLSLEDYESKMAQDAKVLGEKKRNEHGTWLSSSESAWQQWVHKPSSLANILIAIFNHFSTLSIAPHRIFGSKRLQSTNINSYPPLINIWFYTISRNYRKLFAFLFLEKEAQLYLLILLPPLHMLGLQAWSITLLFFVFFLNLFYFKTMYMCVCVGMCTCTDAHGGHKRT